MSLPAELWAIVLAHGVDLGVRDAALRPDPLLWLLCRAINAAFDDLYLEHVAPLLRRGVLVLPAAKRSGGHYGQKRITLALGRSPPERLQLIQRMQGDFFPGLEARIPRSLVQWLSHQSIAGPSPNYSDRFIGETFLRKCPALKHIKGGFCRGFLDLRTLDLEELPIERIGHDFLVWSMVQQLRLPKELQSIGNSFLRESSGLKVLDLSRTKVKSIGNDFAQNSHLVEVVGSTALEVIGSRFLYQCGQLEKVDFMDSQLICLPELFCTQSAVRELRLPFTLKTIRGWVLSSVSSPLRLDLSRCTHLESIGPAFLYSSKCVEVAFPSSITSLGEGALAHSSVKHLDLTACTQLTKIERSFGLSSALEDVAFPPSVVEIKEGCFGWQRTVPSFRIEFGGEPSTLRSIGSRFCNGVPVMEVLRLPRIVEQIADFGFANSTISKVDLSTTKIKKIGAYFGESSSFGSLLLPPTLEEIGTRFLALRTPLAVLDLSHTPLKETSSGFADSTIIALRLPPTTTESLRRFSLNQCRGLKDLDASLCTSVTHLEDKFFYRSEHLESVTLPTSVRIIGALAFGFTSCLKTLDLRCTVVETIGDGFCASSRIRSVEFPSSLKAIGREFFLNCRELGNRLDLSHTKVSSDTIGVEFLKGSAACELVLPSTFFSKVREGQRGRETGSSPGIKDGSRSPSFRHLPSFLEAATRWAAKGPFVSGEPIAFFRPPVTKLK